MKTTETKVTIRFSARKAARAYPHNVHNVWYHTRSGHGLFGSVWANTTEEAVAETARKIESFENLAGAEVIVKEVR